MKALLIAVAVAGMATACTDTLSPVPEPTVPADTNIISSPTLFMDVPSIGVSMNSEPNATYDLVEFDGFNNVVVGKTWWFINEDSSLQANVCWYQAQDSIVMITGRIMNSTYIINLDDSTMNICSGPQGTPVTYRLLINNSAKLPTP